MKSLCCSAQRPRGGCQFSVSLKPQHQRCHSAPEYHCCCGCGDLKSTVNLQGWGGGVLPQRKRHNSTLLARPEKNKMRKHDKDAQLLHLLMRLTLNTRADARGKLLKLTQKISSFSLLFAPSQRPSVQTCTVLIRATRENVCGPFRHGPGSLHASLAHRHTTRRAGLRMKMFCTLISQSQQESLIQNNALETSSPEGAHLSGVIIYLKMTPLETKRNQM